MEKQINIFWFRRDLRMEDNAGLFHALESGLPVVCLFIFDTNILDKLEDPKDARITFIHQQLVKINQQLHGYDSTLLVKCGNPLDVFRELVNSYSLNAVYTNRDYEPYARHRDEKVQTYLKGQLVQFHTFKDQVIFEQSEITKADGKPYTVYTPYMKRWLDTFSEDQIRPYDTSINSQYFAELPQREIPTVEEIGFSESTIVVPQWNLSDVVLANYHHDRDFPAKDATTHLSVHLRFGTLSIRKAVAVAIDANDQFLRELIWREFFMQILWHFPHVENQSFRKEFDRIPWRNNEEEFEHWCNGTTGFPLVDAGMRELNSTGYMHNRVRMVTASFLTKHLLIDWRWGEAYFASKLLDYDLAANNGNWQWAAGCGCDAAPYFRIFSPVEQQKKFDKDFSYISKWVPELGTADYPVPIVEHQKARDRAILTYKKALNKE